MKISSMKRKKWNKKTQYNDDELQNLLLYLLKSSMTAIKEYVEMWYLTTFSKYKDPSVVYSVPRTICERVMWLKNLPKDERPQIIDLNEYGYWYESLWMIRGAKKYSQTSWQIAFFLMSLSEDWRLQAQQFIEERKWNHLVTKYDTLKDRCEKNSIS